MKAAVGFDQFDSPGNGKPVRLPHVMSVVELSDALKVSTIDVIKALMRQGLMLTIRDQLEYTTAAAVATGFGFRPVPSGQGEPRS